MKSGLSVTFPEEPHHAQNPHSHSLCLLPDRQTGPGGIWKTSKPAWALQHCKPLWEVGMIRSWDNLFPQEPAFSGQIRSRELCSQSMHTLTALQGAEGAFSFFLYIYIYVILYICIYMWFCDRYRYIYIYIYIFGSALCRAQLPLLSAQPWWSERWNIPVWLWPCHTKRHLTSQAL